MKPENLDVRSEEDLIDIRWTEPTLWATWDKLKTMVFGLRFGTVTREVMKGGDAPTVPVFDGSSRGSVPSILRTLEPF